MFADIVFPNKNEEQFIEIAKKLNYETIYFVYQGNFTKFKDLDVNVKIASIGTLKNIKNIKKKVDLVLVRSSHRDREILEKFKNILIFDLEIVAPHDFIHHRASGLNQVMCKLAYKNDIMIGFSFNTILKSKDRPKLIGRIIQNIKLCRKYKIKTVIGSFATNPYEMRSPHDLVAFFSELGMHPKEAKNSLSLLR